MCENTQENFKRKVMVGEGLTPHPTAKCAWKIKRSDHLVLAGEWRNTPVEHSWESEGDLFAYKNVAYNESVTSAT